LWAGDDSPGAGHFAVFVSGAAVAVATVVPEPHPSDPRPGDFRLRGMATAEGHRGRGYAGRLTAACVDHARTSGGLRVWLQARPAAVGLYERAGFARETGEFDVPGLGPHVRMALAV
jgi:ribosomal protein S18 acetylase RimI-like enzyme